MEIRENLNGTVAVNGATVVGFIAPEKTCHLCGFDKTIYFDQHDAYACPACKQWLEGACSDPQCSYCPKRPAHPFSQNETSH
ncbi:hypothetical protein LBMAG52_12080 [Planctomycetia bacterium]|nr:hypothetical protein LBMAG52_12080 [Planctomycetia bacterium]